MSHYAENKQYQGVRESNEANERIAQQTNQTNRELAQMQNDWNVQQWERQNEYNSPTNQMKLLRDAGLNPSLVNSQMSQAQNLVSAELANQQPYTQENVFAGAPQYANDRLNAVFSGLNQMANLMKAHADVKYQENQMAIQNTMLPYQIDAQRANVTALLQDSNTRKFLADLQKQDLDYNKIPFYRAYTSKMWADDEETRQRVQNTKDMYPLLVQKTGAEIKNLLAQASEAFAKGEIDRWRMQTIRKHGFDPENSFMNTLTGLAISNPEEYVNVTERILKVIGNNAGKLTDEMIEAIGSTLKDAGSSLIQGVTNLIPWLDIKNDSIVSPDSLRKK